MCRYCMPQSTAQSGNFAWHKIEPAMNVVITGASKGLGLAFAEAFAQGGHSLTLCARGAADPGAGAGSRVPAAYPGITVDARTADRGKPGEAKGFGRWVLDQGRP